MRKQKKLKKKLNAFVDQLTPDEVRKQLVLAYLQMERCLQVLRGEDVEPVTMKDNGLSSDLELFYMCKKVREELDHLNQNENKQSGKKITIGFGVDFSDAIENFKKFKKELEKLQIGAMKHIEESNKPKPDVYVMKVDMRKYFEPIEFDTADGMSMLAFHKLMVDYFSLLDTQPKEFYLLKRMSHE